MANDPPQMENLKKKAKNESDQSNSVAQDELLKREELYHTIVHCADDAIVVLRAATVVECNAAALRLFGGSIGDYIGRRIWQISPLDEFDGRPTAARSREYIREAHEGIPVRFDWTHQKSDGASLYLDVTLTRIDLLAGKRILVVIRDVTDKMGARLELEKRVAFQTLLASLSEGFITAEFDRIEDQIVQSLELICESYDLDRIGMWWFDYDERIARRSHQWNRCGTMSQRLAVGFDMAPWSIATTMSRTGYYFSTLDDLPASASLDKALFEAEGVTSLYFVPVVVDEQTVGNVSYVMLGEERQWSEQDRKELRLIARIVATAWQRFESLRTIRAHQAEIERSQRVAQVGSYTESALPGQKLKDAYGTSRMSKEACEIFAIDPGSETVELLMSRIHPEDRGDVFTAVSDAKEQNKAWLQDYRVFRPDGSMVYVEDRWEVDRDENGDIIKIFGTVKDVTDRVKAHEDLTRALSEIRQLKDQLQEENVFLRSEVRSAQRFGEIVGDNPRFKSVLVAVEKVAPTDVTVLILGETGTGKELVAREIHELGNRRAAAMISVNCAALSSELIESELFGHESGAFTGAQKRRAGRFELADGGTLFLDEIGDLSTNVQAKILRVLQAGEFERLGGNETLKVDVRLIAATNRNLRQMVKDGMFRADLFFRINSFPIELPPLRERLDDISLLANHFVDKHREQLGQHIESIAPQMIHYLQSREWPGNVRELESFIQRAMIACSDSVLDYTEQDEMLGTALSRSDAVADPKCIDLDAIQEQHILSVLIGCNWVIDGESGAAVVLGLPPSTLRSRMKRLGIQRPQQH